MEKIEGHILTELSPVLPSRLSEIKLSKIFPNYHSEKNRNFKHKEKSVCVKNIDN